MRLSKLLFLGLLFSTLTSCSNYSQVTSGKAYLEHHQIKTDKARDGSISKDFNKRLVDAANVEPTISFPARIGLARIENGRVTSIPTDEMEVWSKLSEKLGSKFGEFVPLSVLVSKMISDNSDSAMEQIRLGSARQHFDAVLVYEVSDKVSRESNLLSLGDLTIIGGFIFPSKELKSDVIVAAMLVDVMSGYPYGQASNSASKEDLSSSFGANANREKLSAQTKVLGVEKLADDVNDMMQSLRAELGQKKSKK